MIIDAHTHINCDELYQERKEVIQRAIDNKVVAVFNTADSLNSFKNIDILQKEYPNYCYGVYGIHPEFASSTNFAEVEEEIVKRKNIIKAIGEIGLDYHYSINETEKNNQKNIFISQICLAKKLNLPIVIHSRDADKDTFDILCQYAQDMKVYLHCYSGSYEMAKEYIKKIPNIHFGVGGIVTFKNAKKLVEVVEKIDLKYFLTETDAPYLTPVPFRGKQNEPSYLIYVINKISELKNMNEEKVEEILFENARDFFDL